MSNEQWNEDGRCNICRRKNYCKKDCKAKKQRTEYEIKCAVSRTLFGKFGGI